MRIQALEPLVSVIIPTYNRVSLLPRAINSVLAQTFQDWELILLDDYSTDKTREVVKDYQKRDARIKYFVNDHNKGVVGARNSGIERAQGEFVAFLDSDDEWKEGYLEDMIKALRAGDMDMALSLFYQQKDGKIKKRYGESVSKMITSLSPIEKEGVFYFSGKNVCEYMVSKWMFFYHMNAMVIRKRALQAVGGFDENLRSGEDFEFVFRYLLHCDKFCLLNAYYYTYYETADSLVNFDQRAFSDLEVARKLAMNKQHNIKMLKKMKADIALSSGLKNKKKCIKILKYQVGQMYYFLGSLEIQTDKLKALRHLLVSLGYGFSFSKIKQLVLLLIRPFREK